MGGVFAANLSDSERLNCGQWAWLKYPSRRRSRLLSSLAATKAELAFLRRKVNVGMSGGSGAGQKSRRGGKGGRHLNGKDSAANVSSSPPSPGAAAAGTSWCGATRAAVSISRSRRRPVKDLAPSPKPAVNFLSKMLWAGQTLR